MLIIIVLTASATSPTSAQSGGDLLQETSGAADPGPLDFARAASIHLTTAVAAKASNSDEAKPTSRIRIRLAQTERTYDFDIPAQPLPRAITELSAITGLQVLYDAEEPFGERSSAVFGSYTPDQALQMMLRGTGLFYQFSGADAVTLTRNSDVGSTRLRPISIIGPESGYGPVDGYKASRSATATRTDTPILEVPQSIQVVPRQVIEDQNANRIADVIRNVSSVLPGSSQGNRGETFIIRGFQSFQFARDGFTNHPGFGDLGFPDLANVERVEVLKGPASVLYGRGDPGGLINLVTKKPLSEPYHAADLIAGSYEFLRGTFDISGPITQDKALLFRLNGAYQNTDSFRDYFTESDRIFIAPVVSWLISDQTLLTVEGEYLDQEVPFDRGLVAVGGSVADVPYSRYFGEPFSTYQAEQTTARYLLEHRFNDVWSLRNSFRLVNGEDSALSVRGRGLDETNNRLLNREVTNQQDEVELYTLQNDILAEFQTGPLDHALLFGVEASHSSSIFMASEAELAPIDIFNPVYGATPGAFSPFVRFDVETLNLGIYLQDQLSIDEQWHVLLGGRFDYADAEQEGEGDFSEQQNHDFSPRIGAVYQPIELVSLYANYANSFRPQLGRNFTGEVFEPEEGEQFEVGIKTDLFDRRLSTTLAAFEITKQNVLTSDPVNEGFAIETGEVRSRGIEVDVAGELAPGWDIIASAAYTDAEVTEDEDIPVGNRLPAVPEWSGSLFSIFEFQDGTLQGLGFGAGVFPVGRREGNLANEFEVAGYVRTDATVFYRFNQHVEASLYGQNIFDIDYIETPVDEGQIYPGAPLTVMGEINVIF